MGMPFPYLALCVCAWCRLRLTCPMKFRYFSVGYRLYVKGGVKSLATTGVILALSHGYVGVLRKRVHYFMHEGVKRPECMKCSRVSAKHPELRCDNSLINQGSSADVLQNCTARADILRNIPA